MAGQNTIVRLLLFTTFVLLLPILGQAATRELRCGPGQTIGEALKSLQPGDTLLVSGVCNENVEINEGFHNITLDGQGTAVINAPESSRDAIRIMARAITVRGFTITGGRDGINLRGATGTGIRVDNNTIENVRHGVTVHRISFAIITNNRIRNNRGNGILVFESSSARIGFGETTAPEPSPSFLVISGRCPITCLFKGLQRGSLYPKKGFLPS